jgi:integrase/recombinase XerD
MKDSQIVRFPGGGQKTVKNMDGIKYFNDKQIKRIRRTARRKAEADGATGKIAAEREWAVIDLITSSGVRVSEAANVRCGDVKTKYSESEIFVREGKGSRSRTVQIPKGLKMHLKQFMKWKKERGEAIDKDDYLFVGQRGPWTRQAIQQIVKKYLKALGLYEKGKSVHALRHSYAVGLYRQKKDLKAVQKQLGHASVQMTQRYADIYKEDIQEQIKNLWN